jgi:hypothetical protein
MIQQLFLAYWSFVFLAGAAMFGALAWLTAKSSSTVLRRWIADEDNRIWRILPISVVLLAVAHFALYLWVPSYADYGETIIPILAANFLKGGSVYSDWDGGSAVIGSIYGPYVFIVQSAALAISPSVFFSKLVGIIFAGMALIVFYLAVRTLRPSAALGFCALMVALSSFNLHYWFWNRPDSIFIFLVSICALLTVRSDRRYLMIWIGMLAAIATNLKLFGSIYFVPFAVMCIATQDWRALLKSGGLGAILFVVFAILPFLFTHVDVRVYLENVLMMTRQGFDFVGARRALVYGALIVATPVSLAILYRGSLQRDSIALIGALVVVAVIVGCIAGKPGGGPPYLMPLIPTSLLAAALVWSRLPRSEHPKAVTVQRVALITALFSASPVWAYSWYQMGKQLPDSAERRERAAELREHFTSYPGAEMGHGQGKAATEDGFHRVQKAFLGQIARFDYVNYADQRAAGLPPSILYPLLDDCNVPSWIFARSGERFTGDGFGVPLFDEGIHERLSSYYQLAVTGKHYEVWTCKGSLPPTEAGAALPPAG